MKPIIYVVDDDADLREAILETFEQNKLPARGFSSGREVLEQLDPNWNGVVLTDMRMPGMSGLDLLEEIRLNTPGIPVILFTGHADVPVAVTAMKNGAYEFLEKPVHPEHLHQVVLRALNMRKLQLEVGDLKRQVKAGGALSDRIIGQSKAMRYLRRDILAIANVSVNVLLWGEGGTGKTLSAQAIHDLSPFAKGDFVVVNCSSLTADGINRQLYEDGGAVERAKGGTLMLQGLETLPDTLQAQLLKLFDEPAIPRIIASVSSNPDKLLSDGKLRADLHYRLNVASLALPPLRERGRDVFHLLEHFSRAAAARHGRDPKSLPLPDFDAMSKYAWPGNVRELCNVAEKLVIGLSVRFGSSPTTRVTETYEEAMLRMERELLTNALIQCGGKKGDAAELLGIPRKRLYLRLKHCELD